MSRFFCENGSAFIDRITFMYPGFDRAQHPVLMKKANANLFYFIYCFNLLQKGLLDESDAGVYPDLYEVYYKGFHLLFGERMKFYGESILPQLEVITASCEPIETEIVISAVTDGKLFELMKQDHLFASLFEIYPEDNREVIRFAENAFTNWLLSPDLTREFRVDQAQGNQCLSDWCHFANFSPSAGDGNGYCARWGLHHHHPAGDKLRCGMEVLRRKQIQDGKFNCHALSSGLIIQRRYEEAHPYMIRGIDYLLFELLYILTEIESGPWRMDCSDKSS